MNDHLWSRQRIDVEGFDVAFASAGEGRDVVLLHGTLTSHEEMVLALGDRLRIRHRVTAFDRPGHGDSRRPPGDGSLAVQARLILGAMKMLKLEKPILVGHSAGGALALTIAARYPDAISGVVAIAPLVFSEPRLELFLFGPRALPPFGPLGAKTSLRPLDALVLPFLWHAIFAPQPMPQAFPDRVPLARLATSREMIATGEDALAYPIDLAVNTPLYPFCRVPVRILGGSADRVVNNRAQGFMLSRIMPNCTFQELPGIGHMLHHVYPGRVVDLVEALAPNTRHPSASNDGKETQEPAARRSSQTARGVERAGL